MTSALISFTADGEPWIVCRHTRDGMTHRKAIACTVRGRALLGETDFPSVRPETQPGERAVWRRGGWVIVTRRKRA